MKKINVIAGVLLLSLNAFLCKKSITTSINRGEEPSNNANQNSVPDSEKMPFTCGSGGFDGKRFYVLKNGSDTNFNAYQHTPKSKKELVALLDNKTPLGQINTYYITNMDSLFNNKTETDFTGIENWMTCNVTTMKSMFAGAKTFNGNISGWNVSQVTDMNSIFYNCSAFNQDLSQWNVSQVTTMRAMFYMCLKFNQPLNNWDVSKVTNIAGMFYQCITFNQDISNWKTGSVTDMSGMFINCVRFNQNIGNWNVEQVTNMKEMFFNCLSFNQDISNWKTDNVTDMSGMFVNCLNFKQDLKTWQVSNVTQCEAFALLVPPDGLSLPVIDNPAWKKEKRPKFTNNCGEMATPPSPSSKEK